MQSNILQFPFELLHTKPVSQGGIDVHSLPAFFDLLFRSLVLHSTHIVEPVGNFNEHNTNVLAHSHKHLPQILHLGLLGGGEIGTSQLGDAFHQFRHRGAEELGDFFKRGIGVLDAVVKQCAQNGVYIQTHLRHHLGNRQGVNDIGRAVFPLLFLVFFPGVFHGLVNEGHIDSRNTAIQGLVHRPVMFRETFHKLLLLSRD